MSRESRGIRGSAIASIAALAAAVVTIAAIAEQLMRPPAERTWAGKVFGVIPYDFRVPTARTIREAVWSSGNPRWLVGRAFGVGWTINAYPLWKLNRSSRCCE